MTALRAVSCSLVVLVVVGCGSTSPTAARRNAVNRYLADVQHAQIDLVARQGQIDATLQSFSLAQSTAQEARALQFARTTVDTALSRVRGLDPPPDARRLGTLLVRHLAMQLALVDELIQTSRDVTRLGHVALLLGAAAAQLRIDLAAISATPHSTKVPRGGSTNVLLRYAGAFGRYGDSLRPIVPELVPAHAPSLLRPTLEAQRAALSRSVVLCDELRRTLAGRKADITKANADIHSLFALAASINGRQTRARQVAVAAAYNAKIHALDGLAGSIAAERERLIRSIG